MNLFNRVPILPLLLIFWPAAIHSQHSTVTPVSGPAGIRAPGGMIPFTAPPAGNDIAGIPEDPPEAEGTEGDSLPDSFTDDALPLPQSPTGNPLKQETVSQRWDDSTDVWLDVQRELFTYDAAGLVSESQVQSMESPEWIPLRRTLTTRSVFGSVSVSLRQRWSGSDWMNSGRYLYSYDGGGRLTERIYQSSDVATWRNMTRTVRAYDSLGRTILSETDKRYDGRWLTGVRKLYSYAGSSALRDRILTVRLVDSVWTNSTQSFYEFDASGRMIARRSQAWDGAAWEDRTRAELSYTDRGYLADEISWELVSGEWWNQYRQMYTYHPDGKISSATTQIGEGAVWVNQVRSRYKYEENETPTRTIFEIWIDGRWAASQEQYFRYDRDGRIVEQRVRNDSGSGMENNWLTSTEYDPEGNQIAVVEQRWGGPAWVNVSRALTVWGGLTAIGEPGLPPGRYSLGENFPNPFNPTTTITFTTEETGVVSLTIYDILGREVETLGEGIFPAGTHSIRWEAGDRSGGIYFVRLLAGNFRQTKRIVLLR